MTSSQDLTVIGRAEMVSLPLFGGIDVPARIDTGAKTSTLGVCNIKEEGGTLSFTLFHPDHASYTGKSLKTNSYGRRLVANSTGHVQERYIIKTSVILHGRRIRATFTLADRSTQVYPILVGRNILRGKFIVDVKLGTPLTAQEKQREITKLQQLQAVNQDKEPA